jgi:epoxide hydrolase-like predicted phosphatase
VEKLSHQRFIRNVPLVEFVRSLRQRYKTALLSNVGHSVIETLFTPRELDHLFDSVVLSGDSGTVKPYPEIYELTASRLGLQPEECVMIDDLPKNAEGAEIAGMKGLVYSSMRQLETDLNNLIEAESRHA